MSTIFDYNVKKSPLVEYSFNKIYDLNNISLYHNSNPKVTQYILVSNFIFDLSSVQVIALEKKIMQIAFKKRLGQEFGNGSQVQSVRLLLNCLNNSQNIASSINNLSFYPYSSSIENSIDVTNFSPTSSFLLTLSKVNTKIGKTIRKVIITSHLNDYNIFDVNLLNNKDNFENTYPSIRIDRTPRLLKYKNTLLSQRIKQNNVGSINSQKYLKKKNNSLFFKLKWYDFFGSDLMCASWVLNNLCSQLNKGAAGKRKRNPRPIVNQFVYDIGLLMKSMGSTCPILGIRVTLAGRLGSQKKAMAQKITKCVGKVPLSTFNQNVDYSQHFIYTRFGIVGIKVWVCYR